MSELKRLSPLEEVQLHKTVVDLAHLVIGDLLPYSDEKETVEEIFAHRETLWLKAITDAGMFEKQVFLLRRELKIAYNHFLLHGNRHFSLNFRSLAHELFPIIPRDNTAASLIVFLTYTRSKEANHKDYATTARTLLTQLGYEDGLIDPNLRELSLMILLKKLLTSSILGVDENTDKKE